MERLLALAGPAARAVIVNTGKPLELSAKWQASPQLLEWRKPNLARECGCYFTHMIRSYPNFAPRTLYVQGDACCHTRVVDQVLSLARRVPSFVYLTDKLFHSLKNGKQQRVVPGFVEHSCQLLRLFHRGCNRTEAGGLAVTAPGLAVFEVERGRLLQHSQESYDAAKVLVESWAMGWKGGLKSADWKSCFPMERAWHIVFGEPGILPPSLALEHKTDCAEQTHSAICGA